MPAAERQENVIRYTPRPVAGQEERDLIMLEQAEWGGFCGELTKWGLRNYLIGYMYRVGRWPLDSAGHRDEGAQGDVECCGVGKDELGNKIYGRFIEIRVYELKPGVSYQLRTTVGEMGDGVLEDVIERETVTFNMEREASLNHPAAEIIHARWLTGPWTTGGAEIAAPPLSVSGQTVRSPVLLFGSVELILRVRRWKHEIVIYSEEANPLLEQGWNEYAAGLPSGGRPVALEIEAPPGMYKVPEDGLDCGQNTRGDTGHIDGPEDEEPVAEPEDKVVQCEYCELECDDQDEKDGGG